MYQGLSARALELAKQALSDDKFNLQKARRDYMAKVRSRRKAIK